MRIEWPYNEIEKQIRADIDRAEAEGDYYSSDGLNDMLKIIADMRKHYEDEEKKEAKCQLTNS